ncbi:MAG TPA: hypothetical protein VNA19_02615 [Pyrinomonadaceae bacterium]|jgi:hypothetical protein|nr:hypothetical protein [Pyrinomonadaceae bacterium]
MSAISEIAGRGELASGAQVKVYRALKAILCARCGKEISETELFTRHMLEKSRMPLSPRCRKCVPFQLVPETGADSALLRSLLDAETRATNTHTRADAQAPSETEEKLLSRLGPALSRVRRNRSR